MRNDINNIDALYYTIKALNELLPEARFNIAFRDGGRFDYSGIEITTGEVLPSEEVLLNKNSRIVNKNIKEFEKMIDQEKDEQIRLERGYKPKPATFDTYMENEDV